MKIKFILLATVATCAITAKAQILNGVLNATKDIATDAAKEAVKTNTMATTAIDVVSGMIGSKTSTTVAKPSLTNDEVINGLKEALSLGTNNSSGTASKLDGFLKNPAIRIPWPAEAQTMRDKLIKMGFTKKVNEFETSLNRAAEEASKKAAPVFVDAITGMSIGDGFAILKGSDSSATQYLREKTLTPLKAKFAPVVNEAITKAKVASYWSPLVTAYNKIPGVKKQNPDLNDYICTKAVGGLMTLIKGEEKKIRDNPLGQASALLQKVFGSLIKK